MNEECLITVLADVLLAYDLSAQLEYCVILRTIYVEVCFKQATDWYYITFMCKCWLLLYAYVFSAGVPLGVKRVTSTWHETRTTNVVLQLKPATQLF